MIDRAAAPTDKCEDLGAGARAVTKDECVAYAQKLEDAATDGNGVDNFPHTDDPSGLDLYTWSAVPAGCSLNVLIEAGSPAWTTPEGRVRIFWNENPGDGDKDFGCASA